MTSGGWLLVTEPRMVGEWAVRILLECFLVLSSFESVSCYCCLVGQCVGAIIYTR